MSLVTFYQKHSTLLKLLFMIVAALLLGRLIASERTEAYEEVIKSQLHAQAQLLAELAVAADQNRVPSATGVRIADCPLEQRTPFDALLGRLDAGLSQPELLQLDQLFNACAHIPALRKAVVTTQFKREVEIFSIYTKQLAVLGGTDLAEAYHVSDWQALAAYEATRSQGLADLVAFQKQIIDTLLANKTADSAEMLAILSNVKETQTTLQQANTQATALRAELITE